MLLDTKTRLKTSKHAMLLKISSFDPPTNQHKREQTRLIHVDWGQQYVWHCDSSGANKLPLPRKAHFA